MTKTWRCPECQSSFPEDTVCPACLCECQPDTLHRHTSLLTELMTACELDGEDAMIDRMMRRNRGIVPDSW